LYATIVKELDTLLEIAQDLKNQDLEIIEEEDLKVLLNQNHTVDLDQIQKEEKVLAVQDPEVKIKRRKQIEDPHQAAAEVAQKVQNEKF